MEQVFVVMRQSSISGQYYVEKTFSTEDKADQYIISKTHEHQNWPYVHRYYYEVKVE